MVGAPNRKLKPQRKRGFITGIHFNIGTKGLNQLQFKGDTHLIGEASTSVARRINTNIYLFLEALGGLINKIKRNICGWNIPPRILRQISQNFRNPYKPY